MHSISWVHKLYFNYFNQLTFFVHDYHHTSLILLLKTLVARKLQIHIYTYIHTDILCINTCCIKWQKQISQLFQEWLASCGPCSTCHSGPFQLEKNCSTNTGWEPLYCGKSISHTVGQHRCRDVAMKHSLKLRWQSYRMFLAKMAQDWWLMFWRAYIVMYFGPNLQH